MQLFYHCHFSAKNNSSLNNIYTTELLSSQMRLVSVLLFNKHNGCSLKSVRRFVCDFYGMILSSRCFVTVSFLPQESLYNRELYTFQFLSSMTYCVSFGIINLKKKTEADEHSVYGISEYKHKQELPNEMKRRNGSKVLANCCSIYLALVLC